MKKIETEFKTCPLCGSHAALIAHMACLRVCDIKVDNDTAVNILLPTKWSECHICGGEYTEYVESKYNALAVIVGRMVFSSDDADSTKTRIST